MSAFDSDSDPMLMWIERARAAERERDEARRLYEQVERTRGEERGDAVKLARGWRQIFKAQEEGRRAAEAEVQVLREALERMIDWAERGDYAASDENAVKFLGDVGRARAALRAVPGESETPPAPQEKP